MRASIRPGAIHLYGALSDWQLATGKQAAVAAVWKALGVSTDKTKPSDTLRDWMTGKLVHHSYDVHHQDVVMIIDRSGHLRWITIGHPDARGSRLPTSLRTFLNDEGRQNYARPNAARRHLLDRAPRRTGRPVRPRPARSRVTSPADHPVPSPRRITTMKWGTNFVGGIGHDAPSEWAI